MKILTGEQIKELDKYTIEHEPIASIDLMERAAKALSRAIIEYWDNHTPVKVFAGPGNNGGDALAIARLLSESQYQVDAYLFNTTGKLSEECVINRDKLKDTKVNFKEITSQFVPPELVREDLVIDGLFGVGINKPLVGGFAALVKLINKNSCQVVSIDLPSGLMCEDNSLNVYNHVIRANRTLTIARPKLSFLFAENAPYLGKLECLKIGLSAEGLEKMETKFEIMERDSIVKLLEPRNSFAHKGQMGNALLIAGSYGMAGASILAARACLRSGTGKLTMQIPKRNNDILQIAVPEAVLQHDNDDFIFTSPCNSDGYSAIAIGPGIGQNKETALALIEQVRHASIPVVLDADALNILGLYRSWTLQLPSDIILTPHPKELDRMVGHSNNTYERIYKARELAQRQQLYIVVKGHYTAICTPDGKVHFNSTGNAGMATAGSGDVLTGILLGLLSRGYTPGNACLLGVYLHGLAGDLAKEDLGEEGLIASDIINYLPKAFLALKNNE